MGHLGEARACLAAGVAEKVWLVPTYAPPHKDGRHVTGFLHRLAMLKLLAEGEPGLEVMEVERQMMLEPSYTIDILRVLKLAYPEHDFVLLVGGDSLLDLAGWHCGRDLAEEFEIWSYPRGGSAVSPETLYKVWPEDLAEKLWKRRLAGPLYPEASSQIRRMLANGEDTGGMLPGKIMDYIEANHLYGRGGK